MISMNNLIYNYCSIIAIALNLKASNHQLNQCCIFVTDKLRNSSLIVKTGISVLIWFFAVLVFVFNLKTLGNLNNLQKQKLYLDFKTSKLSLKRDFIKFFESFVVLYLSQN